MTTRHPYSAKVARAQELRAKGWRIKRIAKEMGLFPNNASVVARLHCDCGNDNERGYTVCARCRDLESRYWRHADNMKKNEQPIYDEYRCHIKTE